MMRGKIVKATLAMVAAVTLVGGPALAALARGEVKAKHIAADAVRSKHIKDGQVKEADLAGGAVTSSKIGTQQVDTLQLAAGSVTTSKIAADAISQDTPPLFCALGNCSSKIAAGAIGSSEIGDGQVGNADLAHPVYWAKVDADTTGASILRHNGATGAGRVTTGNFTVSFSAPITSCSWSATYNSNDATSVPGPAFIAVEQNHAADANTLRVRIWDSAASPADPGDALGFTVAAFC